MSGLLLGGLAGLIIGVSRDPFPFGMLVGVALITWTVARVPRREVLAVAAVFGFAESLSFWSFALSGWDLFVVAALLITLVHVVWILAMRLLIDGRGESSWIPALGIPATWVAIEYLRTLGPFHPVPFADFFGLHPWLIQIADVVGSLGLSFILIAVSSGLGLAIALARPMVAVPGVILTALTVVYGVARLSEPPPEGEPLRVAVTQAAVPYWVYNLGAADPEIASLISDAYLQTLPQPAASTDLLIWPETALPSDPRRATAVVEALAAPGRPHLLAGMPRREGHANYNAAWLIPANTSTPAAAYHKRLLVPVIEDDFTAGTTDDVLRIDRLSVAVGICWETVYPRMFRHARDANLIVTLSDLGTFAVSDMGPLHARTTILRAVEQRRPAIHAAQTGPTWIMDAHGRILGGLDAWQRGVVRAEVVLGGAPSMYARVGPALEVLLVLIAPLVLALAWARRRRA